MYAIYALVDPEEIWKVCYIGISDDVYRRFTQHLRDDENGSLKSQWLRSLRDKNRVPYCKVLEDVPTLEEARDREAYWIHFYKHLNMPLTNSTIPQVPQDATTEEQVKEIAVKAMQDMPSRRITEEKRQAVIACGNKQLQETGRVVRTKIKNDLGWNSDHYEYIIKPVCDELGWDRNMVRKKLSTQEKQALREAAGQCAECGATENLEIDHIWPRSLGGLTTPDNLRIVCGTCNRKKGARAATR